MLVFVFGSTTFATATVLAVFMGGLALGSYLAGRRADNIKHPFIWYGILEGIIGVWALIAPMLFETATPLYRYIWQNYHVAPLPFGVLRFCAALVILLVPTTCMGATLPLLSKYVADRLEYIGKKIGTLYAANTLGAVGGAAVAGLYLLPVFGLNRTIFIAAVINFALVAAVVLMAKAFERLAPAEPNSSGQPIPPSGATTGKEPASEAGQSGSNPGAAAAPVVHESESSPGASTSTSSTAAVVTTGDAALDALINSFPDIEFSSADQFGFPQNPAESNGVTGLSADNMVPEPDTRLSKSFSASEPICDPARSSRTGLDVAVVSGNAPDLMPGAGPAPSADADGSPPPANSTTSEAIPAVGGDALVAIPRTVTPVDPIPAMASSIAASERIPPSNTAAAASDELPAPTPVQPEEVHQIADPKPPEPVTIPPPGSAPPLPPNPKALSAQTIAAMISFAISGGVAMIYEVGWTRTLLMVIGSSTYAFTLMLTSFLLGIFLGSLVCARLIDKAKQPLVWLAVIQFLVAGASVFSMDRFNYVPYWNLQLNAAFPSNPDTALAVRFLIAASTMMPLTIFLGAVFPAVVKACVNDLSAVGKSVGSLYSANTLGAIIGAFLAGFILVPLIGVERSLVAGTVVNLLTGVVLLCFVPSLRPTLKALTLVAGTLASWYLCTRPAWDQDILVYAQSARRRLGKEPMHESMEEFRTWLTSHSETTYYEDGASSTVAILKWLANDMKTVHHSLVTNGHVDASDEDDMATQILLACAPIAAHPAPKDIAIIGWGSGVTVGTATRISNGKVTAIELEPAVIKTSPFFHAVNHAPEKDPRVEIEINDGRNFLLATNQKFDVIISEPSNPWQAGVCNLFTKEYFQLAKNRLRPKGIFALWCQIVEIPDKNIRGTLSALHEVFPYCTIMMIDDCDIVVLASADPLNIDLARLRQLMKNKEVANDFKLAGIESPEAFVARFSVPPDGMDKFIGNVLPNDDDTNLLEYEVGRIYENANSSRKNLDLFNLQARDLSNLLRWNNESDEEKAKVMCAIGRQAQLLSTKIRANDWIQSSLKTSPTADAYRLLGILQYQSGFTGPAFQCWAEGLKLAPDDVDMLQTRGLTYLDIGERQKARADFTHVLSMDPSNKLAELRVAQTYAPQVMLDLMILPPSPEENPDLVLRMVEPLLADKTFADNHPIAYWLAAWSHYQHKQWSDAEPLARKFIALDKQYPAGMQLLGSIMYEKGDYLEASACWQRLFKEGANSAPLLLKQAKEETDRGQFKEAFTTIQVLLVVNPYEPQALTALELLSTHEPKAGALLAKLTALKKKLQ